MEDVAITFDPKQFTTALQAIVTKLGAMEQAVVKTGVKTNVTATMMAKGMMMASAGIGIAMAFVRKLSSHMPEIGKSFHIAGDIIMQNLLWPLRKEIIPLLQKMLNWVRDHRAMFVQWGMVLVNIFRVLKTLVVAFFDLFGKLIDKIGKGIKRIFGDTVKSVMDVINVILFKIVAIMAFVMVVLEPIFDFIGDAIVRIIANLKGFFEGFAKGLGDTSPLIKGFIDSLKELISVIGRLIISEDQSVSGFHIFGQLLGGVVLTALTLVVSVVDVLAMGLAEAADAAETLVNALSEIGATPAEIKVTRAEQRKLNEDRDRRRERFVKRESAMWDAVNKSLNTDVTGGAPVAGKSSYSGMKTMNMNGTVINQYIVSDDPKKIAQEAKKSVVAELNRLEVTKGSSGTYTPTGVLNTLTPGAGFGL